VRRNASEKGREHSSVDSSRLSYDEWHHLVITLSHLLLGIRQPKR
jgi:hypothetical protein